MDLDIVAVLVCMVGSAFFSGSETALTSLPITRLEALRQRCGPLARRGLERWSRTPHELLITILVGNNLVNVLASALATKIAYRLSQDAGLAIVVFVMTSVILIFGEITPKTLAQQHAEWLAARVTPTLYVLHLVLRPLSKVLGLLGQLLSRKRGQRAPVTEEDLLFMLRLAHRHAQLDKDTRLMIESVLRFQQAVAREVMIPRPRVHTVDTSWDLEQLRAAVNTSGHSRFPVVAGSPDEIVGVLHAKALLQLGPERHWTELVVPAQFIPENKPLSDLLNELRSGGRHMAIVLDEYGGFSGVVTIEDAVELVVGEIEDEFDQERPSSIVAMDDGFLVPGHLSLRRLERLLDQALEQPEEVDSIGGLVASYAEGPVEIGKRVDWQNLVIKVEAIRAGRPSRLLVRRKRRKEPRRKG